jgi:putative intracellular protease/amidase
MNEEGKRMSKKVLILASNYGLWAEELQGPWDALTKAGHELTLATRMGKTPLPLLFSEDADFVDPQQGAKVNTPEVVARVKEIYESGEWDHPIKIADANMDDYDVLVLVGGPGAPLDITGNPAVHRLAEKAFTDDKIIGAMCYAIGALVWARVGTDIMTPGFVYPLAVIVEDAVGPDGTVVSDPHTTREAPGVIYDHPFVTGLSVESSSAFGYKLAAVLAD